MPRFFFNLRYGRNTGDLATDPEGDDAADAEEARELALRAAQGLFADVSPAMASKWLRCSFEIMDEQGRRVLTVPFSNLAPGPERTMRRRDRFG